MSNPVKDVIVAFSRNIIMLLFLVTSLHSFESRNVTDRRIFKSAVCDRRRVFKNISGYLR